MAKKITQADYQKRLDRLTEIFADMASHADETSRHRCPYRDRFDRCTATIRCRNQIAPQQSDALPGCSHDGQFDYRDAWETDPSSYRRAKDRLQEYKRAAAARRSKDRKPDA